MASQSLPPLLPDLLREVPRIWGGTIQSLVTFAPLARMLSSPRPGTALHRVVLTALPGVGTTTFLQHAAGVALAGNASVRFAPDVSNLMQLMAGARVAHPIDEALEAVSIVAERAGVKGLARRGHRVHVARAHVVGTEDGELLVAGPLAMVGGRSYDLALLDNPVLAGHELDPAHAQHLEEHLTSMVLTRLQPGGFVVVALRRRPGTQDHQPLVSLLQQRGWTSLDLTGARSDHGFPAAH